jgi:hypothetical protein
MTTKITADNISANAVTGAKISDGSIIGDKIAANAIVTAVIANESITGDKIAANTITLDKLEPNVVTQIASAGGGGGGSGVILMTNTLISSNILIPAGKNGLSIGPVTISDGANVTIAPGQRWLVL